MTKSRSLRLSVLIVDASATVRFALCQALRPDPGLEIVGSVRSTREATDRVRVCPPDVLLIDLGLPCMTAFPFLDQIRAMRLPIVVVCLADDAWAPGLPGKALEYGAHSVLPRPHAAGFKDAPEMASGLADTICAVFAAHALRPQPPVSQGLEGMTFLRLTADAMLPPPKQSAGTDAAPLLIAIGASTGGTEALLTLLADLPARMPPIAIVQHMPEAFTGAFARRLDGACRISVTEAQHGHMLGRGQAVVAAGNRHLVLRRQGPGYHVQVLDGPPVARHRPSVDVLFRSVAQQAAGNALGVVLTGMGDDGAAGLLEMRRMGATTLVQDKATSVVFGMPQAALGCGAAERAFPLKMIAPELVRFAQHGSSMSCSS